MYGITVNRVLLAYNIYGSCSWFSSKLPLQIIQPAPGHQATVGMQELFVHLNEIMECQKEL